MTTMIASLHDTLDLAIDLATLGEYGVASHRPPEPGRRDAPLRPAAIHRVCLTEGRSYAARGGAPDPRVAPVTAAARRAQGGAAQLLATQALERQRRLGASVHARRPPAPVASLEAARRRRAAERSPAATHEQLTLDVAAIA